MDYQKIHDQIIERAKKLDRKKLSYNHPDYIYLERHHIILKSLGGSNKKENLVNLTGREHFLVHWLLTRANPENYKINCAFWIMCSCLKNKKFNRTHIVSSRAFQESRENLVIFLNKPGFKEERYKKIKLTNSLKSEEEKQARKDKIKLSQSLRTEEEKREISEKISSRWKSKTEEEKLEFSNKCKEIQKNKTTETEQKRLEKEKLTKSKRTKEEQEKTKSKRKETWKNKDPEVKEKTKKQKSEAMKLACKLKPIEEKIEQYKKIQISRKKTISNRTTEEKDKIKLMCSNNYKKYYNSLTEQEKEVLKNNAIEAKREKTEQKKLERESNPELMEIWKREQELMYKKISLTKTSKTPEQKEETLKKRKETKERNKLLREQNPELYPVKIRTEEDKKKTSDKQKLTWTLKSPEEKTEHINKMLETTRKNREAKLLNPQIAA
jgi:hypothetical protein